MDTSDGWPDDRYRRRLAHRLRRRAYRAAGCPAGDSVAVGGGDEAATKELTETVAKYREQIQRMQAEFDNFRRRARKEKEDMRATAAADTIERLLPVVDNFARALGASESASLESFSEGVRMIHNQFLHLLRDAGLEPVEAKGLPFDPNRHEAVGVDSSGEHPENHVVEVLQEGYSLKGKLIRPAMVKVSRHG